MTASDAFVAGPQPPNAIRIALGACRDRALLGAALRTVAALLAHKPAPAHDATRQSAAR